MKKKECLLSVFMGLILLVSCTVVTPVTATSNPVGAKKGQSTAIGIGPLLWIKGNASIEKAAQNGNISKISTVDMQRTTILFVYILKTKITGE